MSKASRKTKAPVTKPRERIIARAVELFAAHGFDAVTMRLLGDAVGLDNSSLYRHFPSKAALIDAVLDHIAADVLAAAAPLLATATPLSLKSFEDICATIGRHLFDRPAIARLIVHWIMATGEEGAGYKIAVPVSDKSRPPGQLLAALRERLDEAAAKGHLRRHATPEALVLLFGMIVVRPATYGHLLKSLEPKRRHDAARTTWEQELRTAVRGAFAP